MRENDSLVVDVGGVGYQVLASGSVLAQNPQLAEELELIVYTDVRETDISLYGFSSMLEKRVFLLLRKVKGIGARLGMTIVSALGAEAVLQTIGHSDVSGLTKVPGVGKKTAERIVVELREHVDAQLAELAGSGVASGSLRASVEQSAVSVDVLGDSLPEAQRDAVLALEKLGFPVQRARDAVTELGASESVVLSELDAGEILKRALASL